MSVRKAASELGLDSSALGRYDRGEVRLPADLLVRAEILWPDPTTIVATSGLSSEDKIRHALVMLDHVRRTLDVVASELATRPPRAPGGVDGEAPDETALADALEDAGVPVRGPAPPRRATGRGARRSSAGGSA